MRLLSFQAKRFWWKTFAKTLAGAAAQEVEADVTDAVVAFIQVEAADLGATRAPSVFRQTVKHLKWLANKRGWKTIVLHSFTHLGGGNAEAGAADDFITRLATRLGEGGYEVRITPFGYFNEWDLSVYGDSLAKVWKEI